VPRAAAQLPVPQGIVVFGYEYFFGGGVQKLPPAMVPAHFGVAPIKGIPLGSTAIDQASFEEFLSGIQHRYTQATYNLLSHNCNHFTDECANFLLGTGIPTEIRDLPEVFLSTPLGRSLAPMIQQMTDRMATNMDPFAAGAAAAAGGAPAAAPAPSPARAPAAAPAPAAAASASASGPASRAFAGAGSPVRSTHVATMAPFLKLIRAVSATLSPAGDGPNPLTAEEDEILTDGCTALHAEFGVVSDPAGKAQASKAAASMLASGRWASFHALISTMVRTWPPRARPATLFVARTAVLRADGAAYLAEEAKPSVMGTDSAVGRAAAWLAADALSAPAATAATGLLQNAAGHSEFAPAFRGGPVFGVVLGAALHVVARRAEAADTLRRSAASLLVNLALAVDASASEAGDLTDDATSLVLGLVDVTAHPETDSAVVLSQVTALGRAVKRGGSMAAALASSMDAASVLSACEARAGLSAEARAACAACRSLL